MSHNIDSMAYHGDPPWHGLGIAVKHRPTAVQMIKAAGLNWEVEMRPIVIQGQPATKKPRKYQLIRKPRSSAESEIPLAVVSPRYRALQNSEAFEFFDPIVGKNAAVFETAGSLGHGERVWVLAKVPGEMHIVGDDCCERYLLLSNSHDGKGSVSIKFTPIRVVCQNTLILALASGQKAYTVRHSKCMDERLAEVQDILAVVWQTFASAVVLFKFLASVPVRKNGLDVYLERVYPQKSEEKKPARPLKWDAITNLFESGDSPSSRPNHTLWGAYNAVTRYEDYRQTNEAGPDQRLNRVWFGAGADLKLRALQHAEVLAHEWAN